MAIQTKTTSGVEVTLTGGENCGRPEVLVELTHPTAGRMHFWSANYGRVQGQSGIIGFWGSQKACATVPKADFDRAMAEARAIGEKELADLRSGAVPIRLRWQEGSPLSGWTAVGQRACDLLVSLGLAEGVNGWGYLVSREVAERLGETFTLAQAEALAKEYAGAKQVAKGIGFALEVGGRKFLASAARGVVADALSEAGRENEAKLLRSGAEVVILGGQVATVEAAFAVATASGQPVELSRWGEPCDGSVDECSHDICIRRAQPDGSTRVERIHTH